MKDHTEQERRFLAAYRAADEYKKQQVMDMLFPKQFELVFQETAKQEPKKLVLVREEVQR